VNAATIDLVEHVRRRLPGADAYACAIVGPVHEQAIIDAESALGCQFPPSYRAFLRRFGGLGLPRNVGTVQSFAGVTGDVVSPTLVDVVQATLHGRAERSLADHLIVVGFGANAQEWFCLDAHQANDEGEYPVRLFDARDNAIDQTFYANFGAMLQEVLGFVAENLARPRD
jgi:SMI1-KNR4 cell-wall